MKVTRRLILATLGLLTSAAWARDDQKVTPEQFIAQQQIDIANSLKVEPVLRARPITEVLRFSFVDGQLKVDVLASDVKESGTIPLPGAEGYCLVQRLGDPAVGVHMTSITIHQLDRPSLRATTVSCSIDPTRVDITMVVEGPDTAMTTQLISPLVNLMDGEEPITRLYVQSMGEGDALDSSRLEFSAATVAELMRQNHAELIDHVANGFRVMGSMHLLAGLNQRQAEQLLASMSPVPPDLHRQLLDSVKAINSDPDTGESWLRGILQERGPIAAIALAQMPRTGWSADLTLRVDTILSAFLADDPRAAQQSPDFRSRMVDLLYWPDADIRARTLAMLRSMNTKPLNFDPSKDPYTQVAEIEAIRKLLTADK